MDDNQEMVYIKAKHLITQTVLSTKFPFWLMVAMLDSVKSELLEGLYRNSVLMKEAELDATSRPSE